MKKLLCIIFSVAMVSLIACSNAVKVEEPTTLATTAKPEETKATEAKAVENKSQKSVNHMTEREFSFNPDSKFEYTGSDKYLKAITDDMLNVAEKHFGKQGAVEIPTPYIVKTDDSDKNDIKVYGDFYIYGYNMNGTIFNMKNGGSYPGCYHLKDDNGNITVSSCEIAEDGSNNWSSLVKICGDDETLAKEVMGVVEKDDEKTRIEYVKMYAKANNLRVSGIKDYGWPVILFDDIDNASFAYNFFRAYYDEIRQEDTLNDMAERIDRLKEKYLTKDLINKISDLSIDAGADMVINAQDVTDTMLDSLDAIDKGDGNVEVSSDHGEGPVVAKVKIETISGKKMITAIDYN